MVPSVVATVRIVSNGSAARLVSRDPMLRRDALRRTQRVENAAKRECPVDEGRLRNSITSEVILTDAGWEGRVGSNLKYARAVHEGTGIYAGRGYIYPRRARVLSWQQDGRRVFARRVRGQRGNPFLVRALRAAA